MCSFIFFIFFYKIKLFTSDLFFYFCLKALTTGGIPGFVDVVLNFDSKSLNEDNLIYQLNQSGKKILFYGDDTWIKLFPKKFLRSEGTTSFFVTDFTEVNILFYFKATLL